MRTLDRAHLFKNYGDLSTVPSRAPFRVEPGETFRIETVDADHRLLRSEADAGRPVGSMAWNPSTGPVAVEGVRAGEVIAITVEELRTIGHTMIRVDPDRGEPPLLPAGVAEARADFVPIREGVATFPGGVRVPTRPMYGCFGVVPAEPSPEPWHHGGNLDIPDICAGNTVHLRCQRDEAWFCCGDGHAVQGEGEINGVYLEVAIEGVLRIERSPFQGLGGILIESPTTWMMVGVGPTLRDGVVHAVHALSKLVAGSTDLDLMRAFELVSHVADLRTGALWPLWCRDAAETPVPAVLHLPKRLAELSPQ